MKAAMRVLCRGINNGVNLDLANFWLFVENSNKLLYGF